MKFKRIAAMISAVAISVTSLVSTISVNAAGKSFPSGTTTTYAITDSNFKVSNSSGTIYGKSDQCQILSFNESNGTVRVKFPISKGYKTSTAKLSYFVYNTNFNKYYTNTKSNVAVYTKTNMSKKIGTVYASDNTLVVSEKGNLSQILYPTGKNSYKMGWVYTSQLKSKNNNPTTYYVTANSGLRLRKFASTSSTTLTTMPKNSAVSVYSISNGWAYCKYGNKTGYASTSYLSKTKPGNVVSSSSFQLPIDNAKCSWRSSTNMSWANNSGASGSRVYHLGLDLIGSNDNVRAAGAGTVAAAGYNNANGNYVIIKHTLNGKTFYSFYAHLASRKVTKGANVSKGQIIGIVGNTGSSSRGKHLHFAMMNTLWSGSYYGYAYYFTGNKTTFSNVTYYNPLYVINNNKLP